MSTIQETSENLLRFCGDQKYATIYADPPWRFQNRTGKVAPEHKRLNRYETMELEDIMALPVAQVAAEKSHLYLWVPNALLPDGLAVMKAWGFEYKGNIIWEKVRKDGEPDGRGVGFYFRNVTEILLFGVRGGGNRTLPPARSQVNLLRAQKREHSRKPDEFIPLIERCSPGPFLELFARGDREGWAMWGNQATAEYEPTWNTYKNHTKKPGGESFPLLMTRRTGRTAPFLWGRISEKRPCDQKSHGRFASAGQGGGERLPAIQCPALQAPFYRWAEVSRAGGKAAPSRHLDGAAVVCGYKSYCIKLPSTIWSR